MALLLLLLMMLLMRLGVVNTLVGITEEATTMACRHLSRAHVWKEAEARCRRLA